MEAEKEDKDSISPNRRSEPNKDALDSSGASKTDQRSGSKVEERNRTLEQEDTRLTAGNHEESAQQASAEVTNGSKNKQGNELKSTTKQKEINGSSSKSTEDDTNTPAITAPGNDKYGEEKPVPMDSGVDKNLNALSSSSTTTQSSTTRGLVDTDAKVAAQQQTANKKNTTEGDNLKDNHHKSSSSFHFKRKKPKKKHVLRPPVYYCPYDLDQRDEDENTPLHIAIHARKLQSARLLLEAGAGVHKRSDGSAPIHLAISLGAVAEHEEFAEKCLSLLASHGADFSMKDESFHTPLYLACMSNVPRCAQIILSDTRGLSTVNVRADRTGGRPLHACAKYCKSPHRPRLMGVSAHHHHRHSTGRRPNSGDNDHHDDHALISGVLLAVPGIEVNAVNNYGQTPLHVAAARGNWATARLLLRAGANPSLRDRREYTPGQWAAKRGIVVPNDLERFLGKNGSSSSSSSNDRDMIIDPDASTMLLCHELCSRHMSCPPIRRGGGAAADPPPENVRRLHVLLNEKVGILRCAEFQGCSWETEARRAAMIDIIRVHDYTYIERISQLCASIPDHPSAIASLDPDTAVSRWSFEAAMRAAGSVCEAVDKVMAGDHRNAFCAVRPPGHHAGPRGIVTCPNDPEGSHGFCLLNNVAVGAAYARSMYRNDGIRKVAIIDFDVHHGNGTEEIVRQVVPDIQTAPVRTPFAMGTLQTPTYKPWLDEEDINEIFFSSTHGYGPRDNRLAGLMPPQQGGWFYPASGASVTSEAVLNPTSIEKPSLADFISSQTWTRMGEESRMNCCKIIDVGLGLPRPNDIPGTQRVDVRDAYRKRILPHLIEFDPDMIFISAGFDGHKRDGMNFGYVGMIEDDYEWLTEQLVKVANSCCHGRIVSVLEGGYKIHGGIVSPFARSVASHVRALVDGGSSREMYNKEDSSWESRFEREMCEDKERRRQMRHRIGDSEKRHRMKQFSLSINRPPNHDDDVVHLSNDHEMDTILNEPLNNVAASVDNATSFTLASGMDSSSSNNNNNNNPSTSSSSGGGGLPGNVTALGNLFSEEIRERLDESVPARKRRRGSHVVDYKELYEMMKKEGNAS